jgi:hypothetical protein
MFGNRSLLPPQTLNSFARERIDRLGVLPLSLSNEHFQGVDGSKKDEAIGCQSQIVLTISVIQNGKQSEVSYSLSIARNEANAERGMPEESEREATGSRKSLVSIRCTAAFPVLPGGGSAISQESTQAHDYFWINSAIRHEDHSIFW